MYFCSGLAIYTKGIKLKFYLIKPFPINLYIHTYVQKQILKFLSKLVQEKKIDSQRKYHR